MHCIVSIVPNYKAVDGSENEHPRLCPTIFTLINRDLGSLIFALIALYKRQDGSILS